MAVPIVEPLKFRIGMRRHGYNLFALGPTGAGKHAIVRRFLEEQAASEPLARDRWSIAVTGPINQHGSVQPVGGINEQIEGFFDVCQARRLTGDQGVIVPTANTRHLMLRDDVIQAVEAGRFHIVAVDTIDQGIEVLAGMPAGNRDETGR